MENTWANNNSKQPLKAFQSDFSHLKMIIKSFTDQVSSDATTSDTIEIESGWPCKLAFPHGYQVVKEALCQPEGVHFAGFFYKVSSEATDAVMYQMEQTEAKLIKELKVSAPVYHTQEKETRNNFEAVCCFDFNI